MDPFQLFSTLVPSFVGVVAVIFLVIYLVGNNKTPTQPLAVQSPQGHYLPMGAPGSPPSVWQARLFEGLDPFGTFGTVALANGTISFTVEQGATPWWEYPTRTVRARHRGVFHLGRSIITVWLPDGREIGLVVSRGRINRWVNNDFKSMRQIREAHTFLAILGANGAQILAG